MISLADPLFVSVAVPAVLSAWTVARTRAITRAYPPGGRFVETRAGRLHLVDRGEGAVPVVFLHGASSTNRVWEPAFGPRLGALGRTILIDRPGHGFSERRAGRAAAALGYQAEAIADVLDVLGVERAVVVAHSWAGALACRIALDHPGRVAGLVLIAPATHPWPGGVSWYYDLAARPVLGPLFSWTLALPAGELWMKRSIAGVFAPQPVAASYLAEAGIPLALRPRQFMANAEDCVALLAEVEAQSPRYPEIACPLTVISGDQDGVVWTHLHSFGMARDVPHAKLMILEGVGHGPHHAVPDQVVAEIRAMLPEGLAA
jgi:pimeloyl-ACP methyl ester carboxylesterase